MRCTNLCFKNPKEPNVPFYSTNWSDYTKMPTKKFFQEKRFSHGSIYEAPFARTTNRVGPGSYKRVMYPKPCTTRICKDTQV